MHVLSHDGGLLDASCVAVVAALLHFRRPDVSVEPGPVGGEQRVRVWGMKERAGVGLSMLHLPVCVTFSFFERGVGAGTAGEGREREREIVVLDATLQESAVGSGDLALTLNRHGEVCQIAKLGGAAVDALTLLHCTDVALLKVQEITKFITQRLEEDARARDRGGVMAKELSAQNDR